MCWCNKQEEINKLKKDIAYWKEEYDKKNQYYNSMSTSFRNENKLLISALDKQKENYEELKKFSKKMGIKLMKYELFDVSDMINDEYCKGKGHCCHIVNCDHLEKDRE